MRLIRPLFLGTAVSSVLASCVSPPTIDVQAEVEAIRQIDLDWQAAVQADDVEGVLQVYAPNVVKLAANVPVSFGRESMRPGYEAILPDPNISYSWKVESVEVASSGDFGYYWGSYNFVTVTPDGPVEDVGKFLTVWKKIDGEWKVIAECVNSDLPAGE